VEQLFEVSLQENIHTSGIPLILSQPEFLNHTLTGAIVELLENKNMLIHMLSGRESGEGVFISIGGENTEGQFNSFSIVTSSYQIGNMKGTLGVIGPTRMPYPKLISAVDYTAKIIGQRNRDMK